MGQNQSSLPCTFLLFKLASLYMSVRFFIHKTSWTISLSSICMHTEEHFDPYCVLKCPIKFKQTYRLHEETLWALLINSVPCMDAKIALALPFEQV